MLYIFKQIIFFFEWLIARCKIYQENYLGSSLPRDQKIIIKLPRQDAITIEMKQQDIIQMNRINFENLLDSMYESRHQKDILEREEYNYQDIVQRYNDYLYKDSLESNEEDENVQKKRTESKKVSSKSK